MATVEDSDSNQHQETAESIATPALDQSQDQGQISHDVSDSDSVDQSDKSTGDQDEISAASTSQNEDSKPLSRRQLRKLKKRQYWESMRQERRRQERQRRQERKREARASGQEMPNRKRLKVNKSVDESKCKISVVIDMSFDDYMSEKDMKKALTQIQYSYSANRRSENPMRLLISSFCGKSRSMFDQIRGCTNWDENSIQLKKEHYLDIFQDKEKIVYLTSESPNVLTRLEEDNVYIIGGLVDHNAQKGLCHRLAEEKGLKHARLPIDEYVVMKTRKVLTINHVFEIMLKFTESGDWEKSFFHVIPKRKEVEKKS